MSFARRLDDDAVQRFAVMFIVFPNEDAQQKSCFGNAHGVTILLAEIPRMTTCGHR